MLSAREETKAGEPKVPVRPSPIEPPQASLFLSVKSSSRSLHWIKHTRARSQPASEPLVAMLGKEAMLAKLMHPRSASTSLSLGVWRGSPRKQKFKPPGTMLELSAFSSETSNTHISVTMWFVFSIRGGIQESKLYLVVIVNLPRDPSALTKTARQIKMP